MVNEYVFYVTMGVMLLVNVSAYMTYQLLRKNVAEYMAAQLELNKDFDTRIQGQKALLTVVSGQDEYILKRVKKIETELYGDEGIVRKLDYLNEQKTNTESYLDLYERINHLESEVEVLKNLENIFDDFSFEDYEEDEDE